MTFSHGETFTLFTVNLRIDPRPLGTWGGTLFPLVIYTPILAPSMCTEGGDRAEEEEKREVA